MKQFKVCIELEAPLLSTGTASLPLGVDAQQLVYQEEPVVPGSLVRGLLRHAWHDLNSRYGKLGWPVEKWLGEEGRDSRGQLIFSHFFRVSAANGEASGNYPSIRIAIDENTDTAEPKMLKIIDTYWPTGTRLRLDGAIAYLSDKIDKADLLERAVVKGLHWATALGSEKGVGFGHILSVDTTGLNSQDKAALVFANSDRQIVSLGFDRPVCFAKPHNTEQANRFDSEAHMPGAALLAVLNQCGISGKVIDKISVSHFKPASAAPTVPMSWVCCNGVFFNAACEAEPFYVENSDGEKCVPTFPVDWKAAELSAAMTQLESSGAAAHSHWLEVRTAIQEGSNRPKKSQLFSLNCLQTSPDDLWSGTIDISTLSEMEKKQVQDVFNAGVLGPFGKTDALAEVHPFQAAEPVTIQPCEFYRLMLTSDAALVEPSSNPLAKASYESYWKNAFGSLPVELASFYLDEYLGGGRYLHERFGFSGENYNPQIMARAGSVFVLRCTDASRAADMATTVQKWIRDGIPEPSHFINDWKNKPWAHANGYGRIQLCPEPEQVKGWSIKLVGNGKDKS